MAEANIDSICGQLKCDLDKLQGEGLDREEVDSFNLSEFWPQFEATVQALSNEVSKVCFMCSSKPFPKIADVSSAAHTTLQYYKMLRDMYVVLPEEVGAVIFRATTAAFINIASSLLAILQSVKDLNEKGSKERLLLVGTFWDACHAVQSLPKNNLIATLNLLEGQSSLASDALEELKTGHKNDCITDVKSNTRGKLSSESDAASSLDQIKCETSQGKASTNTSNCSVVTEWINAKTALNEPFDLASLESDIHAINSLLTKLEKNDPLFVKLSDQQKLKKQTDFIKQLEVLLEVKRYLRQSPVGVNNSFNEIMSTSNSHYSNISFSDLSCNGGRAGRTVSSTLWNSSGILKQSVLGDNLAPESLIEKSFSSSIGPSQTANNIPQVKPENVNRKALYNVQQVKPENVNRKALMNWVKSCVAKKCPINMITLQNQINELQSKINPQTGDGPGKTIEEDLVGDDCDDGWTSAERELASRSVGLVKVTHSCLQRLCRAVADSGSYSTAQHCTQLDTTADTVRRVSPALDDFVSELYHPIDVPLVMNNANKLVNVLKDVLASVKGAHFEKSIDEDVIKRMLLFIGHNHSKVDPSVQVETQLANLNLT